MSGPRRADEVPIRALLIQGDREYATAFGETARAVGPDVRLEWTATLADARVRLEAGDYDLILFDLVLRDSDGIDGLVRVRQFAGDTPILVLTALRAADLTLAAMREGAEGVLVKSEIDLDGVLRTARCAVARRRRQNGGACQTARQPTEPHDDLEGTVQASPGALLVVDDAGHVLMLNPAAAGLMGRSADTLVGQPFGRPVVCDDVVEVRIGDRAVELRAAPAAWDSAPAFVVSMRDVTDHQQSETELRAAAAHLQQANERLTNLANEDPLTGLLNRRGMDDALLREVERMRHAGGPLTAIILDCDQFKAVNDRLGHAAGDLVLKEVARRLACAMRPMDSLARIGGDEFLVLVPEARLAEVVQVAERLRMAVGRTAIVSHASQPITMTVSVGVAPVRDYVSCVEEILPITHLALKKSKASGKNQTSSTGAYAVLDAEHELDIIANLERYVASDGFFRAVSQPIVGLDNFHPVGREFLVRGPSGSYEAPDDLFRLCRDRDVLTLADLAALRACIRAASEVPRNGECYHFNVFPSTLLATHPDRLLELFPQPFEAGRYCLEISEQQFIGDPSHLREPVMALKRAGMLVALDQVGFAGTALEGLIVLEPDVVKLERCCVQRHGIKHGCGDRGLRRAERLHRLVRLFELTGATVIAEGIETSEEAQVVADAGIWRAQGYHLGAPE